MVASEAFTKRQENFSADGYQTEFDAEGVVLAVGDEGLEADERAHVPEFDVGFGVDRDAKWLLGHLCYISNWLQVTD